MNKHIKWTEKGLNRYIQDICDSIDDVRRHLWDEEDAACPVLIDNHGALMARQTAQAEVIGAIMDYRNERMGFSELLMSLQAFDPKVTPEGLIKLLGRSYHG